MNKALVVYEWFGEGLGRVQQVGFRQGRSVQERYGRRPRVAGYRREAACLGIGEKAGLVGHAGGGHADLPHAPVQTVRAGSYSHLTLPSNKQGKLHAAALTLNNKVIMDPMLTIL